MDEGESSNGFSDWEQIQLPPLSSHSTSTHHSTPLTEPDTVHQGLETAPADEPEVNSSVGSNNDDEANSGPLKEANQIGQILSNGVVKVVARVRYYMELGLGNWSFGVISSALTALLVSFVYAKTRKWRARVKEEKKDRLILLIQEKDQKINQLLFQVAHMKELISTRRRVPVLRVS